MQQQHISIHLICSKIWHIFHITFGPFWIHKSFIHSWMKSIFQIWANLRIAKKGIYVLLFWLMALLEFWWTHIMPFCINMTVMLWTIRSQRTILNDIFTVSFIDIFSIMIFWSSWYFYQCFTIRKSTFCSVVYTHDFFKLS